MSSDEGRSVTVGSGATATETRTEEAPIADVPADSSAETLMAVEEPTLSVIMPTLNEEEGVGECIRQIKDAVAAIGVSVEIIVSDSSTDRTPAIAREMGAQVVEPDRDGYGYAYRYAFERTRGDYIAIGDADTTYDFTELPKLFGLVASDDADMAIGSRLNGTIDPGAMKPLHRYVGNPLLTAFLNVCYGVGVSDAHSGFRLISKDALDRLKLSSNGMEFASEMIMDASEQGLRIEEVPIRYRKREGEATLSSFRDGWRHVRFMLENAPWYLFSVPGTAITGLGVVTMLLTGFNIEINGQPLGVYSMAAGALLTIVGYQVMTLGIFSAIAGDPIRTPNDVLTRFVTEQFKLGYGATVGCTLLAVGSAYLAYAAGQWFINGYTALPPLSAVMLSVTAVVIGIQTVFSSFFFSVIAE